MAVGVGIGVSGLVREGSCLNSMMHENWECMEGGVLRDAWSCHNRGGYVVTSESLISKFLAVGLYSAQTWGGADHIQSAFGKRQTYLSRLSHVNSLYHLLLPFI